MSNGIFAYLVRAASVFRLGTKHSRATGALAIPAYACARVFEDTIGTRAEITIIRTTRKNIALAVVAFDVAV